MVLLEPCLNPAAEAQAIGRVHRLGQQRPVKILRLIVENSIESRIVEFLKKKFSLSSSDALVADVANVGSMQSDKSQLVREELDALFDVKSEQGQDLQQESGQDMDTTTSSAWL